MVSHMFEFWEPSGMGLVVAIQLFLLLIGVGLVAIWIWTLIDIITSKFKEDLMQIVWLLVVFFLPFFGVLLYLVIGRSMKADPNPDHRTPRYKQLAQIKTLLDDGVITPEEFEAEKRKILEG